MIIKFRFAILIITLIIFGLSACDKDKKPPVITIIGDNPTITGKGIEYIDAGATAYDEEDGDITDKIVVSNEVNIADTGTYFVRYNVKDDAGNAAEEKIRTVSVIFF